MEKPLLGFIIAILIVAAVGAVIMFAMANAEKSKDAGKALKEAYSAIDKNTNLKESGGKTFERAYFRDGGNSAELARK